MSSFTDLGVPADLVAVLANGGITAPFPVQALTIPDLLAGRDVCGSAPTGSGKTIAFGLPLVDRVGRAKPKKPRGLVLAPTRELAAQIQRELAPLGRRPRPHRLHRLRRCRLRAAAPGDAPRRRHPRRLPRPARGPHRPAGRGPQHGRDRRHRRSRPDGRHGIPPRRASHPRRHREGAPDHPVLRHARRRRRRHHAQLPARRGSSRSPGPGFRTRWMPSTASRPCRRATAFARAPRSSTPRVRRSCSAARATVPTRSRRSSARPASRPRRSTAGSRRASGTGRSQSFTRGMVHALVATDVAARGIHVDDVACVLHFDPPTDAKTYVHRSGRTARKGASGVVVSFLASDQMRASRKMQRELGIGDTSPEPRSQHRPGRNGDNTRSGRPPRRNSQSRRSSRTR